MFIWAVSVCVCTVCVCVSINGHMCACMYILRTCERYMCSPWSVLTSQKISVSSPCLWNLQQKECWLAGNCFLLSWLDPGWLSHIQPDVTDEVWAWMRNSWSTKWRMQIWDFQEVSDFLTGVRYPICVVKQAPVCVCTVLSSGSEKWLLIRRRCDRNLWENQNLRFTSSMWASAKARSVMKRCFLPVVIKLKKEDVTMWPESRPVFAAPGWI